MLQWGGLSRTTAEWPTRWAAIYRGYLYILPNEDATSASTTYNFWIDRCCCTITLVSLTALQNMLRIKVHEQCWLSACRLELPSS